MELRQLKNFLAVVDQGSVSSAASVIRLAQPALSRQLQALEFELGASLLVRHPWGVSPTPEGQLLAEHARRMLQEAQSARNAISALSDEPSGKFTVGVVSSLAATILPALALEAGRSMPRVSLQLVESYSATLHQRILANELDFAIVYRERQFPTLKSWPLFSEAIVAVGGPGVFDAGHSATLQELVTMPLILPTATNRLRILFEEAAAEAGVPRSDGLEVDSVAALKELLAAGAGVSILPYSTVHAGVSAGRFSFAPIGPRPLVRDMVLVRPSERLETPAWKTMADLLRRVLLDHAERYDWVLDPGLTP